MPGFSIVFFFFFKVRMRLCFQFSFPKFSLTSSRSFLHLKIFLYSEYLFSDIIKLPLPEKHFLIIY